MNLLASQVIERYKKYGFEYKKYYSNDSYLTFTFRSGFFHNAEVIKVANNPNDFQNINKKIENLNKLGVSAKITEHFDLESIEKGLFDGFFDVDIWRDRIRSDYESYVESVIDSYPESKECINYSYIDAPYNVLTQKEDAAAKIIDDIASRLNDDSAQLILIEAPAGFGKTCTSYELINSLVNDSSKPIPFFTEFSRDRQARIFSHVFVREVDRAFNQVKSDVVEYELKNGRIVMVLDGFDELLSDTQKTDSGEDYENAEPMLETISELLSGKSKIIITSRKSAIFDGATFSEWIDRFNDKFKFVRYRIDPPKIEDWLDAKRRTRLEGIGLNLKQVSNPVLLSYLRFVSDDKFEELCCVPDDLVGKYFSSMLEREQERQNLLMTPEKQSLLLTKLAEDMCERDYTSESKDKLIDFFKTKCISIIEETRKLYKGSERPTVDSLSNTLSNHAFFDRSNQGDGRIEFINEFVFGNYIAEGILGFNGDWLASDERFVEPAISSYVPRHKEIKEELWAALEPMLEFIGDSDRLKYELSMLGKVSSSSYNQTSIMSLNLIDVSLFKECCVKEITFSDCIFSGVKFYIENIEDITFINCKFYGCVAHGASTNVDSFLFLNCFSNNEMISDIESTSSDDDASESNDLSRVILETFWKVGSSKIDRIHMPLPIIYKAANSHGYNKRLTTIEIKKLKRAEIIANAADDAEYVVIDVSKKQLIKELLGRE